MKKILVLILLILTGCSEGTLTDNELPAPNVEEEELVEIFVLIDETEIMVYITSTPLDDQEDVVVTLDEEMLTIKHNPNLIYKVNNVNLNEEDVAEIVKYDKSKMESLFIDYESEEAESLNQEIIRELLPSCTEDIYSFKSKLITSEGDVIILETLNPAPRGYAYVFYDLVPIKRDEVHEDIYDESGNVIGVKTTLTKTMIVYPSEYRIILNGEIVCGDKILFTEEITLNRASLLGIPIDVYEFVTYEYYDSE